MVPHVSTDGPGAGRLRRHVPGREGHVPPTRRRHRHAVRHRGVDRGRRRGAPPGGDEPQRPGPRDRRHQLRRDCPGSAGRRPRPPRVRQALRRDGVLAGKRGAAVSPTPARAGRSGGVGGARPEPRRQAQGSLEWESDRARSSAAGAAPRIRRHSTGDRSPAPRAPCSTPSSACGSASVWRRAASSGCRSRRAWPRAGKRPWRWPTSTGSRAPRRGPSPWRTRTRRAPSGTSASRARRRRSSSAWRRGCCTPTGRSAPARRCSPTTSWVRRASGRPASPATSRSFSCGWSRGRPAAGAPGPAGAGVLEAQGLTADVVILNEHPVELPRRDHAQLTALFDNGPGRAGTPARRRLPAARRSHGRGRARPSRRVARAVLSGDRGELAQQLDRPHPPRVGRPSRRDPAAPGRRPRVALASAGRRDRSAARPRKRPRGLRRRRAASTSSSLDGDHETPMPWANVIANPSSGPSSPPRGGLHVVGERRENRLTPFANDPLSDPTAEAMFLRDDETGEAWSPTRARCRATRASGRFVDPARRRGSPASPGPRRHPPRASILRGGGGPGKFLPAHFDQRGRVSRGACAFWPTPSGSWGRRRSASTCTW